MASRVRAWRNAARLGSSSTSRPRSSSASRPSALPAKASTSTRSNVEPATAASSSSGKHLIQSGLLALAPDQIKVNLCYDALLAPGDWVGTKCLLLRSFGTLRSYLPLVDADPAALAEAQAPIDPVTHLGGAEHAGTVAESVRIAQPPLRH